MDVLYNTFPPNKKSVFNYYLAKGDPQGAVLIEEDVYMHNLWRQNTVPGQVLFSRS